MKLTSVKHTIKALSLLICMGLNLVFAQKTPQTVIILHVNDMHARIDNMAKLAYLRDSLLRSNPLVFLVAAGDNFTGNPVVDMVSDKGYPMIDLMNRCGFDATAIGNHEFDLGQDFLNNRISQAHFPFICCNIDASGGRLKQPPAYTVLSRGDSIKLLLLGIVQRGANGLPDSHPLRLTGLSFVDGIEKAGKYIYLKEQYHNLIALTHLGVDADSKLAEAYPQFDLIIGGHSHTLLDTAKMVNGVMIVQAGSQLKWVGKTSLSMQHGQILSRKDEIIPLSAVKKENKEIRSLIDKYNNNEEMERVAGRAERSVKGPEELGSLMSDALRKQSKSNIALVNRGGIRVDSLGAGEIRMKDVYRLDPFGNQVVSTTMTREEIASMLCHAYNISKRPDLEVSGITYTITTGADGSCMNVTLQDSTGSTLPEGNYSVVMSSYIASAYAFDHTHELETHDITTAEVLIEYLKTAGKVDYSGVRRIHTVAAK